MISIIRYTFTLKNIVLYTSVLEMMFPFYCAILVYLTLCNSN